MPQPRPPPTHPTRPTHTLQIVDEASGRVMEVKKAGFPDFVVWNPWVAKSQAMADFGDEEYKVSGLLQQLERWVLLACTQRALHRCSWKPCACF